MPTTADLMEAYRTRLIGGGDWLRTFQNEGIKRQPT
jgi:hypothetical protein